MTIANGVLIIKNNSATSVLFSDKRKHINHLQTYATVHPMTHRKSANGS